MPTLLGAVYAWPSWHKYNVSFSFSGVLFAKSLSQHNFMGWSYNIGHVSGDILSESESTIPFFLSYTFLKLVSVQTAATVAMWYGPIVKTNNALPTKKIIYIRTWIREVLLWSSEFKEWELILDRFLNYDLQWSIVLPPLFFLFNNPTFPMNCSILLEGSILVVTWLHEVLT